MTVERRDLVIIGGGIVGSALAWTLRRKAPALSLRLLEKEVGAAHHQSGRNSGVVHSGLYYAPDSMKARTCRAGRLALERFLHDRGLPYRRCGKVVVALNEEEDERLDRLAERGVANGLAPRRLTRDELAAREPAVRARGALLVPETGVTDYARVAEVLAKEATAAGAEIHYGHRVVGIEAGATERRVRTRGADGSESSVEAETVVVCAGLQGDRLARAAGLDPETRIVPFRGEYWRLRGGAAELCRGLVYPVPDPRFPFLGVHLTRDVHGEVEVGPNAVPALAREGYRWRDIDVRDLFESLRYRGFRRLALRHARTGLGEIRRSLSRRALWAHVRPMLPDLRLEDLERAPAGVRAQALRPDGTLVDDFAVTRAPGLVAVLNAPSPAATASLAIAEELAAMILESGSEGPA